MVTGPLGTQPQPYKWFQWLQLRQYIMGSLVSYALEQPEMLRIHDYKHKCDAPFYCAPTVYFIFMTSLPVPDQCMFY